MSKSSVVLAMALQMFKDHVVCISDFGLVDAVSPSAFCPHIVAGRALGGVNPDMRPQNIQNSTLFATGLLRLQNSTLKPQALAAPSTSRVVFTSRTLRSQAPAQSLPRSPALS